MSRVFVRFDAAGGDQATFTPAAQGLYYNRNRWYSPALGRFTTKDPNETALLVLGAMAVCGGTPRVSAGPLDPQSQYSDGLHLYQYVRGNPFSSADPSGLFSYAELTGNSSEAAWLWASAARTAGGVMAYVRGVAGAATAYNLAVGRIQKDELEIRPIWHHKPDRVLAHILVCFLAYVLWKALAQ